jgi:hypothetical protein
VNAGYQSYGTGKREIASRYIGPDDRIQRAMGRDYRDAAGTARYYDRLDSGIN